MNPRLFGMNFHLELRRVTLTLALLVPFLSPNSTLSYTHFQNTLCSRFVQNLHRRNGPYLHIRDTFTTLSDSLSNLVYCQFLQQWRHTGSVVLLTFRQLAQISGMRMPTTPEHLIQLSPAPVPSVPVLNRLLVGKSVIKTPVMHVKRHVFCDRAR